MRIENHPIKNLQISTCHATKSYGYCIRERQKSLWITIIYKENLCTKWDFCIKRDRKGEAKQKREEFRWSLAVKWQRQLPLPWRRQPSRYIVSPPKPPSTAPPCRVCLPVSLLQLSPLPSGQFQVKFDFFFIYSLWVNSSGIILCSIVLGYLMYTFQLGRTLFL